MSALEIVTLAVIEDSVGRNARASEGFGADMMPDAVPVGRGYRILVPPSPGSNPDAKSMISICYVIVPSNARDESPPRRRALGKPVTASQGIREPPAALGSPTVRALAPRRGFAWERGGRPNCRIRTQTHL